MKVLALALLLLVAACDSGDADPGPTTSSSTTTTTIDNDTCDRVGDDTVRYLEDLIDVLDETRLDELVDPDSWGEQLRDLHRAGKDLDLRVSALRCDAAEIQQHAFAEADLVPEGALSQRLVELLLTPPVTSTTTTPPATSTTTVDSSTTTTTVLDEG